MISGLSPSWSGWTSAEDWAEPGIYHIFGRESRHLGRVNSHESVQIGVIGCFAATQNAGGLLLAIFQNMKNNEKASACSLFLTGNHTVSKGFTSEIRLPTTVGCLKSCGQLPSLSASWPPLVPCRHGRSHRQTIRPSSTLFFRVGTQTLRVSVSTTHFTAQPLLSSLFLVYPCTLLKIW